MRWFWCSQLPLLIIIHLSEPIEALLSFKSAVGNLQQLGGWVGRSPCPRPKMDVSYTNKLKYTATSSLYPGTRPRFPQSEANEQSPCDSTSCSQQVTPIRANFYTSRKTRRVDTADGDLGVTTLAPTQSTIAEEPEAQNFAAIISGCVGAVLLVAVTVFLVYICLMRTKRSIRRTSETASSALSPPVGSPRENGFAHARALSPYEPQNLRQISILELELATSRFSQGNVIGNGSFGLVYKGLLQDGSIVAIKRRLNEPSQYFVHDVESIGRACHKHLVKLIGFCQENHQQLLVYDYLPNGNVGSHLYDNEGSPIGKLDIRQRVSIALGAAKGLEHLHSLTPPQIHMHFRTRNVLVDENFMAKVSDFGVSKLIIVGNRAGSSSSIDGFRDPELRSSHEFSEESDSYSFGVFLLELISGREVLRGSEPWENLVVEAKSINILDGFIDKKLMEERTMETTQGMMKLALKCVDISERRTTMKMVVQELELIQNGEMGHQFTNLGEEISVVTLGSELFK